MDLWGFLLLTMARLFPGAVSAPSEWWKRRRSGGWPLVQGRIHEAVAVWDENFWVAHITYSYSVNGEYYSGEDKQRFATERRANEYADRFPTETTVFIRYNPNHPDVSVMRRDEQMGMGAYAGR